MEPEGSSPYSQVPAIEPLQHNPDYWHITEYIAHLRQVCHNSKSGIFYLLV